MRTFSAVNYAKALFAVAQAGGAVPVVRKDITRLAGILLSEPRFSTLLNAPNLPLDLKKSALKSLSACEVDPFVVRVFGLLINNKHADKLAEIADVFEKLCLESEGVVTGTVYGAYDITDEEIMKISSKLGPAAGGKKLALSFKKAPELLAGVKIRLGDKIYDYSVARYLESLLEG
jgi:F-type H+-transporting ATPase subunit delta